MIYGLDPLYWMIMLPVLAFSLIAQGLVKKRYRQYARRANASGLTGRQAAEEILRRNGAGNVRVEASKGWLSDHYSPAEKTLRLSPDVYKSASVAAVGIAAHEAGHALQHRNGWAVMRLWQSLAKPAAFASNLSVWFILIGMLLGFLGLAKIGFVLFTVVVLFQLVTLPVEFDASRRAKALLPEYGIVSAADRPGVDAVLNSAALTYVAAAASSIAQLLYFALRLGILGGDD